MWFEYEFKPVAVHVAQPEAHVLTDGLAGAESRMIGILALHRKSARERDFPLVLLEKGLKVKIEEACHNEVLELQNLKCSILLLSYVND